MNKLFSTLTILMLVATVGLAQVNSGYDGPKPEVKQGSKSFVFFYTPFQSDLQPVYVSSASDYPADMIDLYGAGFRYFVTNEIAVGVGLNFGTGSSSREYANGDTEDNSGTSFGISVDGNYHLPALYSVSPYVGLNINFGSYSTTQETTSGGTTNKIEYSGSGLGGGANFGFDWYFTEGLSLGGRYTLGFRSLSKPEQKTGNTTVEGASSSVFGIGSASVILNVHF